MANENVLKNDEIKQENPKTLEELFLQEFYRLQEELNKANEQIVTLSKVLQYVPRPGLTVANGKATLSFGEIEAEAQKLYEPSEATERFVTLTNFYEMTDKLVEAIKAEENAK